MLSHSGCATRMVASFIVKAPNQQTKKGLIDNPEFLAFVNRAYAQHFLVKVGSPSALLSVGVVEPGDYKLAYSAVFKQEPDNSQTMSVNLNFQPLEPGRAGMPPLGTIVVLHGIMLNKASMMPWALHLAQHGYRVVLVDLRGHGRSNGDWISYGAREAGDLVQVADELEKRGFLKAPLGVLGLSYGASIGLEWAARDPRVRTVVALQPFSDPRLAIVQYARGSFQISPKKVSDETFAAAELKAARLANFRWEDADVLAAVRQLKIPVLFFHGAEDQWIPPAHSKALMALAPAGSELRLLPGLGHLEMTVVLDPMAPEVVAWFDGRLNRTGLVIGKN